MILLLLKDRWKGFGSNVPQTLRYDDGKGGGGRAVAKAKKRRSHTFNELLLPTVHIKFKLSCWVIKGG